MKNQADIETRLKAELQVWSKRQSKNIFADFYLYYMESTPEHDGGFIICEVAPPNKEYQLAMGERINKGATIEQNFNWLRSGIMRRLPILSIK